MKLLFPPMDHQLDAIRFAEARKYSINAFEMGLGKTYVALSLAVNLDVYKTLIVVPAFLIPNWISEVEKFTGETCSKSFEKDARFYVVSYSSLKKFKGVFAMFDYVICDEVHYAKNLKAQRTKLLHSLIKKHQPDYFLGLSGTPIKNRVPEFYSLLKLCFLGNFYPHFSRYKKSFYLFNLTFCHKVDKYIAGRRLTTWEGIKDVPKLKELIKPVYFRRRTKDVLKLPDEIEQQVLMSNKSQTDTLLEKAFDIYKGKKLSKTISSVKAISALAKTKYTADFVKDRIEEAGKFIIFTDHVQTAQQLGTALSKLKLATITGKTPIEERHRIVTEMNEGDLQIVVATIGSMSVGVNLTGVNHMIFNDYPWVGTDIAQAKKRIHRIGQKKTCFYYFILASQLDRMILNKLKKKQQVIQALEN